MVEGCRVHLTGGPRGVEEAVREFISVGPGTETAEWQPRCNPQDKMVKRGGQEKDLVMLSVWAPT